VKHVAKGTTCIGGLDFTPRNVIASVDAGFTQLGVQASVSLAPDVAVSNACGPGFQAAVATTNDSAFVNATYYVSFE
jgi:hypothetical protein